MKKIFLSEYYPILHSYKNICLTNSGDTFLCYSLELPEIFTLSKSDYTSIHDFWFRALKYLPSNTIIHKQDIFIKENYEGLNLQDKTFLQKSTINHFKNRGFLNHFSLLFIGQSTSNNLKKGGLSNPFKKAPKLSDIKTERLLKKEFIDEVEKAIEFLNGSKYIKAIPLHKEEIHHYIKNYFNGFELEKNVDTDNSLEVKTSSKNYNAIGVGDKRVGVYTINNTKQLPEYVDIFKIDTEFSSKKFDIYKGSSDDFSFRLHFNHIYNQIIFISDQLKEKSNLESKRENLYGARGFSADNENASEELTDYLKELSKDDSRLIVYGHTNLIYYANTDKEFENYTQKVSSLFKNLDFRPHYPNKNGIKDVYIKSLFAFSSKLNAKQVYQTELHIALTTFINTTSYRNDEDGIIFSDRLFNLPIRRDVRDYNKKRIKAWNFMVLAPTGEGKSVLMQHVFRQFIEQGKKIVLFDIGGSFKKLAYLMPEEKSIFIQYEPGEGLGINPFYIGLSTPPDIEKLNHISNFIYKLWKPGNIISNEELTPLRKIVESYYKNMLTDHSFPNFYDFVYVNKDKILDYLNIESRFFDIENFILYCSEFVKNGQYSFLFKKTNEKIKKAKDRELIVFEFDKAKNDEVVLSVLMQLASFAVQETIWVDKSTDGVIFYDEAAKFFKNKAILDTVIFYYQAIRKQTGAVGTALQSPAQLPQGDDVQAMIDNTQVLYILFNEKGYQSIVDRFKLSDHQHNILKSITPNLKAKRPYTEFALIIGKEIWILRLELSKEAYFAYQTDGREYEEIMLIYDKYNKTNNRQKAMVLAIDEYIKNS